MQKVNGLEAAQRSIVEDIREISQRSGQYHDSEKVASQQADIDNLWGHIQYIQHAVSEFRAWQEKELKKATSSFETGVTDGKDAPTLKQFVVAVQALQDQIDDGKPDLSKTFCGTVDEFKDELQKLEAEYVMRNEENRGENKQSISQNQTAKMINDAMKSSRKSSSRQ